MAIPVKALLFLGGASVAALGTAYVAGVFDPRPAPPVNVSQPVAPQTPEAPAPAAPEAKAEVTPPSEQAPEAPAAAAPAPAAIAVPEQQAAATPPAKPDVADPAPTTFAPSFDVLRVEPDGSMVVAGKAMAGSMVEALAGSRLLGKAEAGANGDFVIILDDPLKPGDYQVVLRSTGPGQIVVNSVETAVVSVPATAEGQVLALVEQPGAPSKLITATPAQEAPSVAANTPPAEAQGQAAESTAPAPAAGTIMVEAVEIDGRKVFIAGSAPAGSTVRGYANTILIGDAKASADGRFLIEAERDLPVGDYIVRVDVLSPGGDKVVARATVPFKREAGESIAAVAPAPKPVTEQPSTAESATAPAAPAQAPEATAPAPGTSAASDPNAPAQPAQEPETAAAPQLEPSAAGVIIRRGDTLWQISKRVYGRGTRFSTIYAANKTQIADPDRIWPGQVFRVPDTSEQGESADMDTVKDQATTIE